MTTHNSDDVKMDVDPSIDKSIKIHPLVMISLSDHYTRSMMWMIDQRVIGDTTTTTSNNNNNKDEEIDDVEMMGLLYGIITDNNSTVSIVDAEEIPTSTSQGIQTKIELHQKVFPSHKVVGWYRVCSNSNTSEPTQHDLEISTTGWIQKYTKTPLFLFFHPHQDENEENDESLPCILYDTTSSVFLNLEFEMTTLDPERIAIESVILSCSSMQKKNKKNKHTLSSQSSITTNIQEPPKDQTKTDVKQQQQQQQEQEQEKMENDYHLETLKGSMEAFNTRLEILQEFLQQTYSQKIPTNYHLLRQVNSLLDLLFQHDQNDNKEYQHMMVVSHLATIAKTTFAIQNYTEKYRKVASMAHMGNTNTVSSSSSSSKTKGHHLNPWRTVGGNAGHPSDNTKIT